MAAVFDPVVGTSHPHAFHHYVLAGKTQQPTGPRGNQRPHQPHEQERDSISEESYVNGIEKWRRQIEAGEPTSADEKTSKKAVRRRRSTGPTGHGSPSPATTLPANSRQDVSVPKDISTWRAGIPLGVQPPDDVPWASPVPDHDSVSTGDIEEDLIAHSGQKPARSMSSTAPTSIPPSSGNVDVHQWRYENFVDWWRTGMSAHQGIVSPPPQINELSSSSSSRAEEQPHSGRIEARPAFLTMPSPPGMVPEPQVTRLVQIPSEKPHAHAKSSPGRDNLKRIYYRLISQKDEPIPVRDLTGTSSKAGDKSLGVLLLDNSSAYRAGDLTTIILSKERIPNSSSSPGTPRHSSRLRKKFADTTQGSPPSLNLRSPTAGTFAVQQQLPPVGHKIQLYYEVTALSDKAMTARRRLQASDSLPPGVGVDATSALIAKLIMEDAPGSSQMATYTRSGRKGGRVRRGLGAIVRGLASLIRGVGDGLSRAADLVSGSAGKSKHSSSKD